MLYSYIFGTAEKRTESTMYSVSQLKKSPLRFSDIFPKRLEIFSPNFTRLLYVAIYARLKFFIQLITCNFDEVMPY